jgi:tetratricopeptide (TPR) repeat protein
MAKKQKIQSEAVVPQPEKIVAATTPPEATVKFDYTSLHSWLYEFKGQAIIVALLAFAFYCNSFSNEFAHDDGIVIVKNEYVLEGFAGIPAILTKDAYDSYYRQLNTSNQLSGGRYRPLSIVTFAIEQQFLGATAPEHVDSVLKQTISYGVTGPSQQKLVSNMHVRHVFNVLWYMLSVVVLLYFLRYIVFRKEPIMALIAAVLFTIHPIHTEVVANVKSRDEIMSLLFMCSTFIFAFRYDEDKTKKWLLAAGMVSYMFAFLSKEYAITMMALLPLAFYIFKGYSFPKSIQSILPYALVTSVYVAIRVNVMAPPYGNDGDPMMDLIITKFPFLAIIAGIYAIYSYIKPEKPGKTDQELFMKNVFVFLPYFAFAGLYLFQRYHAIPPVVASAGKEVLNNPYVYAEGTQKLATEIASTMSYLRMLIFPFPLSADYSYAQIPYKDFTNPLVWISIAVHAVLIGIMIMFFPKRQSLPSVPSAQQKSSTPIVTGRGIICFALAFYFLHLLLVCNIIFDIGATLGERLIYHSSVGFAIAAAYLLYKGALKIQPAAIGQKALAGLMTVLILLCGTETISRNANWKNDAALFTHDIKVVPNSVLVNANVAASYITMADYAKDSTERKKYLMDAVAILNHTLDIHKTFVAAYLNRGIAWYKLGEVDKCVENINHVKQLYPTYPTLPGMYKLICDYYLKIGWDQYGKFGKYMDAVEVYKKGLQVDSASVDLWYNMGGAYYTDKKFPEAISCFKTALKYQPNNAQAQNGLNAALSVMNNGGVVPQTPVDRK